MKCQYGLLTFQSLPNVSNDQQHCLMIPRKSQTRYTVNFFYLLIPRGRIAYTLTEGFDSLSASAQKWYEIHFPDTEESFWDKIKELGPNIKEHADELFHHALELYPSEKLTELRESMVNISATTTVLRNVCSGAAEDSGVSFRSVIEEHQDIFVVLFKELIKTFPPPEEAISHDNRTIIISTALDRFEEGFLQVATELGVSEEQLKKHSSSLKFVVQHVMVTSGTSRASNCSKISTTKY